MFSTCFWFFVCVCVHIAVGVTDEAGLRKAILTNPSSITLDNNITISSSTPLDLPQVTVLICRSRDVFLICPTYVGGCTWIVHTDMKLTDCGFIGSMTVNAGNDNVVTTLTLNNMAMLNVGSVNVTSISKVVFSTVSMFHDFVSPSRMLLIQNASSVVFAVVTAGKSKGGCVAVHYVALFSVLQTRIVNCSSDTDGAGLYGEAITAALIQSTVVEGCFTTGNGGGIALWRVSNISMSNTIFRNNAVNYSVAGNNGGGMYLTAVAMLRMTNMTFDNCYAYREGGGAYIQAGLGMIALSSFNANTCGTNGGALSINQGQIQIIGSSFTDNVGWYYGGSIFSQRCLIVVLNSQFLNSNSLLGGCMMTLGGYTKIFSSNFWKCNAITDGGALFAIYLQQEIVNSTFKQCAAQRDGGGVCTYYSDNTTIAASQFDECSSFRDGGGVYTFLSVFSLFFRISVTNSWVMNNGGCLYLFRSDFILKDSVVTNCTAPKDGGCLWGFHETGGGTIITTDFTQCQSSNAGGGVNLASFRRATLNTVSVSDSSSLYGGCMYLSSVMDLTTTNVRLTRCSSSGIGGALHAREVISSAKTNSLTISDSDSNSDGGCVYMNKVQFQQLDAVLRNCTSRKGEGGAVYLLESTFNMRMDVRSSSAMSGGCVNVDSGTGRIYASQMVDCYSWTDGGAISTSDTTLLSIEDTTIQGAHAEGMGGGLNIRHGVTQMTGVTLMNTTSVKSGGAVALTLGSAELTQVTIDVTTSETGQGGALYTTGSTLNATSLLTSRSTSHLEGGSTYVENSTFTCTNCSFTSSVSQRQRGGCLYGVNCAAMTLSGTRFEQCTSQMSGGGVHVENSQVNGTNVAIVSTTSNEEMGGGLHVSGGWLQMDGLTVTGTQSVSGTGGGISVVDGAAALLRGSVVRHSSARKAGGSVYVSGSTLTLSKVHLLNGTSQVGGGAFVNGSKIEFSDVKIEKCRVLGDGGGMLMTLSTSVLTGVNLVGNVADGNGGGAYVLSGVHKILNSNVSQCRATVGAGVYYVPTSSQDCVQYLRIYDNVATLMGGGYYGPQCLPGCDTKLSVSNNAALLGPGLFLTKVSLCPTSTATAPRAEVSTVIGSTTLVKPNYTLQLIPGTAFRYNICVVALDLFRSPFDVSYYKVALNPPPSQTVHLGMRDGTPLTSPVQSGDPTDNTTKRLYHFFPMLYFSLLGESITLPFQSTLFSLLSSTSSLPLSRDHCPSFFVFNAVTGQCDSCPQGTYRFREDTVSTKCKKCDSGVHCSVPEGLTFSFPVGCDGQPPPDMVTFDQNIVGSSVFGSAGYWWTRVDNKLVVRRCIAGYCDENNTCTDNHDPTSSICARCLPGYHTWGNSCVHCDAVKPEGVALRFITALVYVITMHYCACTSSASLAIITAFLEAVALVFQVRFMFTPTKSSADMYNTRVGAAIAGIVQGVFDLDCFAPLDAMTQQLIPLMHITLLVLFVPFVAFALQKHIPFECVRHTLCGIFLMSVQLVTKELLESLTCIENDDGSFMFFQPMLACGSSEHTLVVTVFSIVTVAICVSLGAFFAWIKLSKWAAKRTWPVFFGVYKRTRLAQWWAPVVLARRILFLVAFTVGVNHGGVQAYGGIGAVSVIFGFLQYHVRPYKRTNDNRSEMVCLLGLSLLCLVVHFGTLAMMYSLVVGTLLWPLWNVAKDTYNSYRHYQMFTEDDIEIIKKNVHPADYPDTLHTMTPDELDDVRRSLSYQRRPSFTMSTDTSQSFIVPPSSRDIRVREKPLREILSQMDPDSIEKFRKEINTMIDRSLGGGAYVRAEETPSPPPPNADGGDEGDKGGVAGVLHDIEGSFSKMKDWVEQSFNTRRKKELGIGLEWLQRDGEEMCDLGNGENTPDHKGSSLRKNNYSSVATTMYTGSGPTSPRSPRKGSLPVFKASVSSDKPILSNSGRDMRPPSPAGSGAGSGGSNPSSPRRGSTSVTFANNTTIKRRGPPRVHSQRLLKKSPEESFDL